MRYLSTTQVGGKSGIVLQDGVAECVRAAELKVPKAGSTWIIPEDADRPAGARIKSGR